MSLSDFFGKKNIKESNEPENALVFHDKKKPIDALTFINKEINSETNFAITKDTEKGKYVVGGLLTFHYGAMTILTDVDNIIFVDTEKRSVFIRNNSKSSDTIAPSDPEARHYVILYYEIGFETADGDFPLRWESCTGRTAAFASVRANAPVVDIDKSIVLVDTVALKDALSVREFCKYLQNSEYINTDEFNIDDYTGSDYV